jgi:hypothetical protein
MDGKCYTSKITKEIENRERERRSSSGHPDLEKWAKWLLSKRHNNKIKGKGKQGKKGLKYFMRKGINRSTLE